MLGPLPGPGFLAAPARAGGPVAGARASSVRTADRAARRRTPTSSRPAPHEPELALWHGVGLPRCCSPSSRWPPALPLFVARRARRPGPGRAGPPAWRPSGATGGVHAAARPVGGRGHRRHPARLAAAYLGVILIVVVLLPGLGRCSPRASADVDGGRLWDTPAQAVVGAVVRRGGRSDGALAAAAARGPPRRRHRLRHGHAVPAARRARPRADPGPGRDASPWWCSCWCCAGSRSTSPTAR